MSSPRKWKMSGPGFLIPVFFLSVLPVSGQDVQDPAITAAGGCFASSSGIADGCNNQAALGWVEARSLSMQHARPFLLGELGITAISFQARLGDGGFGGILSTTGITGFRLTSAWIGYGLKLRPRISAGIGLHFWNTSIPEQFIYHPGVSCALGIQVRISENFSLGGHVLHPVAWTGHGSRADQKPMMISAGISYRFFGTATYRCDLHLLPEGNLQWCHGIEVQLQEKLTMLLGMHNRPYTLTGGISLQYRRLMVVIATEYRFDAGTIPSTSLSYAW
jgi:hypothetical protein